MLRPNEALTRPEKTDLLLTAAASVRKRFFFDFFLFKPRARLDLYRIPDTSRILKRPGLCKGILLKS